MSKFNEFWDKFKKRKILRVALTYFVIIWILIQIGAIVFPALNLPEWSITLLIVFLVLLFPVAIFLAWTYEKGSDGFTITNSGETKKNTPSSKSKNPLRLNLILIFLVVIVILWYFVRPAILADSLASNKNFLENKSIAVLYFDNMSGDQEQEYFSDGITEEIIARLSTVEGIRVISRTSTRVYKGKPINLKKIAQELNVSAVLEGSFRQSGNKIKVTAQLINAETDEHIWAQTFSSELDDVFQVQADIAHAIAKKFEMNVSSETTQKINNFPTSNTKSYELYLKARHILYNQYISAEDSLEFLSSKDLFEKAIVLDSSFADAYAGLSELYDTYSYNYDLTIKMDSTRRALADKAYSLNSNSSYVNHVMGWKLYKESYLDSAIFHFRKAIKLNPNDYLSYGALGNILRNYQLDDLALPFGLKAVELDPLNASLYASLGYSYWMLGDMKNANKVFKKAYDIAGKKPFNGRNVTAFWLVAHEDVIEGKQVIKNLEINWWFLDVYILYLEGDLEKVREKVRDHTFRLRGWWGKAEMYAMLNNKPKMLEALRYGADFNFSLYKWLQNTEPYQKYQNDPEFQEVLEIHKKIYDENKRKYGFNFNEIMDDLAQQ